MIKDKQNSITRVDGRLKVTGSARYAAEHPFQGLLYGALVNSTIAKGIITGIDSKAAEKLPGVVAVISHLNAPKIPGYAAAQIRGNSREIQTFNDNKIYFNGQPVVLVVADTFERAKHAASLVKIKYTPEPHKTSLTANLQNATRPGEEGDYLRGEANAYRHAPVKIEVEYRTPIHVHNAMEPFAVTAIWDGDDKVTEYTKSQYIKGAQRNIMNLFKLPEENVRVYSKVIGGAFGSGSGFWPHEKAALIGAKMIGKPLKVVIDREQMFTMVGYRSPAVQKIGMGATADGKLVGITHVAIGETSTYQVFAEGITSTTTFLYNCPNINTQYKLARLDLSTPTYTRGPGETTGVFALESAMDELAHELKMDPLELRRKNYSENDQSRDNMPYSSKYLNECYDRGAEEFGWDKRNPVPGSVKNDGWLVGYGMSNGVYGTHRAGSAAKARISADGKLLVQSSTSDMGPGTATVMVKIAADAMDMPAENIIFELGSSDLPPAPGEYGSMTTSSVGSAVYDSCMALKGKFNGLAGNAGNGNPDYIKILKDHNLPYLETTVNSAAGPNVRKYSSHAFCAHFVEVNVHPATGEVKISRMVSAVDGGTILNPITARSQIIGGIVWGIGMALMEGGVIDHRYGKYVNSNLSEYHLATNADVPQIDVLFIDKKDPVVNPMGSKGIGEVAIVGFAAAVANAIFNATGKRVRELPITPDKLV
jgi:xanthine dehydrogenase YagR molybdenum-binding subunit